MASRKNRTERAECEHPNTLLIKTDIDELPIGGRYTIYRFRCPDCGLKWDRSEREH